MTDEQTTDIIEVGERAKGIEAFRQFETNLAEFKARYDGKTYDLDDYKQNKTAKSDRLAIGKVISKLDQKHREIKAPLKEQVDLIDATRKKIKDELLDVQDGIKSQLAEHDAKIAAEAAAIEAAVEFLRLPEFFADLTYQTPSIAIKTEIDLLHTAEINARFGERVTEAEGVRVETLRRLETAYVAAKTREKEAAELEEAREKIEAMEREKRDEAIRVEASEKAKREAEEEAEHERQRVEEARIEAEAEADRRVAEAERASQAAKEEAEEDARRAEAEKLQAEADAKRREEAAVEAERVRIENERLEAERIEAERLAKEEKKKSKAAHRKKIEKAATAAIGEILFQMTTTKGDGVADCIVQNIAAGNVPNVQIVY